VFSVIFGGLAKVPSQGLPYPIFVFSALVPWTFFAGAVATSGNSLVNQAHVIGKVYFPRIIVPLSSVGGVLVDFAIASCVLLGMMLFYHVPWTWQLLAVPPLCAGIMFTTLGIGTGVAALTAAYRDFRYVVPFTLQLWMFATPVVYPGQLIPAE